MSTNSIETHGDSEEKAPLYALSQPTLPEPDALPSDIRDFLTEVLSVSRGLAREHAGAIADKWKLGTGRELRNYPPKMYLEIFGPEEGWCVYKEVKTRLLSQKDMGALPFRSRVFLIALSVGFMVSAYRFFTKFWSSSGALYLRVLSFVAFFIFGAGGLACWLAAVQSTRTVDEQVEQELAEVFARERASSQN